MLHFYAQLISKITQRFGVPTLASYGQINNSKIQNFSSSLKASKNGFKNILDFRGFFSFSNLINLFRSNQTFLLSRKVIYRMQI